MRLKAIAATVANETGKSEDIIYYGLQVLFLNVFGVFAVLTVGLILQALAPVVAAYIGSASLRIVTGGPHLNTPIRCLFFSSMLLGLLGVVAQIVGPLITGVHFTAFYMLSMIWVGILILKFAPRDVPQKPISTAKAKRLRKWAVILWLFWLGVILFGQLKGVSTSLLLSTLLGLCFQSVSLVPRKTSVQRR